MSRNKKKLAPALAAVVAALSFAAGCATLEALRGDAPPAVAYYAAASDYVAAKIVAAEYVELPSTPSSHVERVADAVERGDAIVARVERLRTAGVATPDRYEAAAGALRVVASELRRLAAEGRFDE